MTKAAKYIIGIDLGTTNCTFSYCQTDDENFCIQQLAIPQITAAGVEGEDLSLPSFLYIPLQEENDSGQLKLEGGKEDICVGVFAKNRGAELPTRVVNSAKSWACHQGIDRKSAILPMDFDEADKKLSPLKALSLLLSHLKNAWEKKIGVAFEEQKILITVPASFDPAARQLVEEAAKQADYPAIILLEEPQAAFYAWLDQNETSWRKRLAVGDNVLVVDIGGGTTDFSFISVSENSGDLQLERIAVGSHLLLGGDNIDLSLAYLAKNKLEEAGHVVEDFQIQALTHAARNAKEQLFSAKPPKQVDITIMGRGRKLIGNSLKTTITTKEAQDLILEGFMPLVELNERSLAEKSSGLKQIGLPFAEDARITAQLAKFLSMTGESDNESLDKLILPTAVLFNGGTMKADAFRSRIIEQLNQWLKAAGKKDVLVLEESDLDFAVSKGAVYYGLSTIGQAIRIKSGASRSFFVGVEDSMPAIPGVKPALKAICVVPFGMEEGSELELPNQEFALAVGELASFRFFSHSTKTLSNGVEPFVGTVVKNWKQELTELPMIETQMDKKIDDGKVIRVKLKSKMTELGILELYCIAEDARQWKLEFETREV